MTPGHNPALVALTQRVTELPALPQALVALMRLLREPDFSERQCVALIERDQALAARLLRLANSAFYGVPGRVGSIGDAMRILGAHTVFGVLTAAALHSQVRVDACPGFHFDTYWRHTIATALAARALAGLLDSDADEAFLAGLLHDVGQLVLASFNPEAAGRAIARAQQSELSTLDAETVELGFAHPQIGALVARHWHFPEAICHAIEWHHQPELPVGSEHISTAGLVHIADKIAHTLHLGGDAAAPVLAPEEWAALGLGLPALGELLAATAQGVNDICEAFDSYP